MRVGSKCRPGTDLDFLRFYFPGTAGGRDSLSPRWGLSASDVYPRLMPWAAFLRRFAAKMIDKSFTQCVRIGCSEENAEILRFAQDDRVILGLDCSRLHWPDVLHGFAELFGGERVEDVLFG